LRLWWPGRPVRLGPVGRRRVEDRKRAGRAMRAVLACQRDLTRLAGAAINPWYLVRGQNVRPFLTVEGLRETLGWSQVSDVAATLMSPEKR